MNHSRNWRAIRIGIAWTLSTIIVAAGCGGPEESTHYEPTAAPLGAIHASAPTGSFTQTGSLLFASSNHTATLLPNGQVLIAGGLDMSPMSLSRAELYDPPTGRFLPTGSLNVHRWGATATLLPNGKVLVIGGAGRTNYRDAFLSSAELYDPATGTFTITGSMSAPRVCHTTTLLPNGKVLVAGGEDANGSIISSAELYDPSTGLFRPTRNMGASRCNHTATALPNGKVLLVGGEGSNPASAEIFDPVAQTFWFTSSTIFPRHGGHVSALLPNGEVFVAGGSLLHPVVEKYNPSSGTFRTAGNVSQERYKAVTLPNGNILLLGGDNAGSSEQYDPTTEVSTATGSMATPRVSLSATLLLDGRVLVTGGYSPLLNRDVAIAELYQ